MGKPQPQRTPGEYTLHYYIVIFNGIKQRLRAQSIHDGYIEVLSFTSYSLVSWLLCHFTYSLYAYYRPHYK